MFPIKLVNDDQRLEISTQGSDHDDIIANTDFLEEISLAEHSVLF